MRVHVSRIKRNFFQKALTLKERDEYFEIIDFSRANSTIKMRED